LDSNQIDDCSVNMLSRYDRSGQREARIIYYRWRARVCNISDDSSSRSSPAVQYQIVPTPAHELYNIICTDFDEIVVVFGYTMSEELE
jgi:hypothetical protein